MTHVRPQTDASTQQDKLVKRTRKDFVDGICSGYWSITLRIRTRNLQTWISMSSLFRLLETFEALIHSMLVIVQAG